MGVGPDAHRRGARYARALVLPAVLALAGAVSWAQEPEPDRSGAPVTAWNYPIVTFRASHESRPPATRAALARARIDALPVTAAQSPVVSQMVTTASTTAALVRVGEDVVFVLLPGDVDTDADLEPEARAAAHRLALALRARAAQEQWPVILRGLGRVALASVAAIALLVLLARLRYVFILRPLDRLVTLATSRVSLMHPELCAQTASIARGGTVALLAWSGRLVVLFAWITFALLQFPLTVPLGERLGGRFGDLVERLAVGAVQAVPGVFVAFIIFLVARAIGRLLGLVATLVSSGALRVPWMHRDTAHATYRLALGAVWGGALIAAYPYIPGSGSDAFTGLGLFLGLVASLGSAGLAGQAMSGLSAVYSRTLRPGEYVRIGDVQGQVLSVGLLATKLRTQAREEVTVPNSILVTEMTTNYSRLGKGGAVVTLSVGLGYDVPWRQAVALLRLAASRTPALASEPPPRVQQRQFRKFDVEYVLSTFVRPGYRLPEAYSALLASVQDAFNEYGVQLMTPQFEADGGRSFVVPKDRWYAPPARPHAEATERPTRAARQHRRGT